MRRHPRRLHGHLRGANHPHTISSGTSLIIHTTNPDKTYNGIILSGSYEAGHIHTYNITLGNDRVSITPTDKDLSWNDGDIRPGLPPTGYDLTVSTAKELKAFADAVNNGSTIGTSSIEARSARVLQTADIDLTGIDDWTPIGNVTSSYNYFQGSYNGNGYTISNLKIKSGESYMGLFGLVIGESSSTPAVLTGIHLRNVDIDVSHNSNISCGAIAGTVSDAVITFCSAQGEIKTDMNLQGQAYNDSGGIIADNSGGTISYCRADVKVTAFSDSNTTSVECNAGGIAGINTGTILACEASGSKVSAKASSAKTQAGGIAGKTSGGNYIASCASEVGKIIANSGGHEAYAGGVVGLQSGVLYSSYARGDATAVGASTINMAGASWATIALTIQTCASAPAQAQAQAGKVRQTCHHHPIVSSTMQMPPMKRYTTSCNQKILRSKISLPPPTTPHAFPPMASR
ncbi:hypothetical protein [Bacteroides stercorirosoris]|uniref:hypothetical protein n=1 Tax=Bacteroides stercorirosoris TaxID=871324 RepID=UPI00047267E5|nr:hypothetical protein [Bacteroides stercorirosoris]